MNIVGFGKKLQTQLIMLYFLKNSTDFFYYMRKLFDSYKKHKIYYFELFCDQFLDELYWYSKVIENLVNMVDGERIIPSISR